MTEALSAVCLELNNRAESPAIVRAALAGVGQILDLDSELFDDLKTALSEACNNVVLYAYDGEPGPYVVGLEIRPDGIGATVRDWGGGIQQVGPSEERMGVGLAVISALADRAEFISPPDGGTEVRMVFNVRGAAIRSLGVSQDEAPATGACVQLSGDVVATVWPAGLLAGVLGRVARAVAARTQLSLDRFSDIYLVTDAIAAFAQSGGSDGAITFAVTGGDRRVELTVGPFPAGDGARLLDGGLSSELGSPIAVRVGALALEGVNDFELVRVVIDDRRPR
ncbi:MAG TPA: ATP-binding protein [Solirubrobacteraceae bacterium]|nr:ATP-binding protein [Solirubrobacteraceae bacterium]